MAIDRVRLESLIDQALQSKDIAPHVANKVVSRGLLLKHARDSEQEIGDAAAAWLTSEEAAQHALDEYQASATQAREAALKKLILLSEVRRDVLATAAANLNSGDDAPAGLATLIKELPEPRKSFTPPSIDVMSAVLFVAIGVSIVGTIVELALNRWAKFPTWGLTGLLASLTALFVVMVVGNIVGRRVQRMALERVSGILAAVGEEMKKAEETLASMQANLDRLKTSANNSLFEAIVRVLRRHIDTYIDDDYSTTLPPLIPSGLAEGFNATSDFLTPARERVKHLLSTMPNGSIGISGSRGAGKSTLLRTFAARRDIERTNDSGEEKKVLLLAIEASAPVQYDGRDFVLHLFSLLCVKIRELAKEPVTPTTADTPEAEPASRWVSLFEAVARRMMLACAAVGTLLMIVAVTAAIAAIQGGNMHTIFNAKLSIKPLDLAVQALLWIMAAALLFYFDRQSFRIRRQQAMEDEENQRLGAQRDKIGDKPESFGGDQAQWEALVRDAREHARMIRYQRSYSVDVTLGAKLGVAEAALKRGESWQEQRLTLPEIVTRFRQFVEAVAQHYLVLIAIDELDKIASDEKAQQFINELKVMFGIPNCFYLITVSDNAMSSFARRGLPIRDTFDSAFDEIVRVEHMDLDTAQKLIAGRVIGLPIPFVTFCYLFSAGLPRDMIRTCRDVFEQAANSRELCDIARAVFRDDLLGKVEGSITAITQSQKFGNAAAAAALDRLWGLKNDLVKKDEFLEDYADLVKLAKATAVLPDDDRTRQVQAMTLDLASYLYYALTVLKIIEKPKDKNQWEAARTAKLFEELAQLRRYIGVESAAAGRAIDTLRIRENLPRPVLP
ncbi:MAG TPA: P-loop NTPase fold protein [Thermoanaerobaculia bacterium]|nr:P-loop NTPase fold protein [Thermoanaerobaculia bacterium]